MGFSISWGQFSTHCDAITFASRIDRRRSDRAAALFKFLKIQHSEYFLLALRPDSCSPIRIVKQFDEQIHNSVQEHIDLLSVAPATWFRRCLLAQSN